MESVNTESASVGSLDKAKELVAAFDVLLDLILAKRAVWRETGDLRDAMVLFDLVAAANHVIECAGLEARV